MGRGINTSGGRLTTTTDGQDLNRIWQEFIETNRIVNEHRTPISRLFTFDTTDKNATVSQSATTEQFELASEFGVPKSLRPDVAPLPMGFPLDWFDGSARFTEKFLRDASAQELEAIHNNMLQANDNGIFRATLRAIVTKTTIADRPVNEDGTPVYSLWDGDTDSKPPTFAGQTFAAGHSHYLTSQSVQVDGKDLADLTRHITHHGYGTAPTDKVIILVHPNQGEAVRGFRIGAESPFDFIPSEGGPAYLTTENLVGERAAAEYNGLQIIGSYGVALIAESYFVPSGYVIASATSGAGSARNPLAFRISPRPEYQGLRLVEGLNARYPIIDSYYQNGYGLGVRHRGAAAVLQVTTSTTYTNPTV